MAEVRDLARAWQAVLGRLQIELPGPNFKTFLEGSRALRMEGDTLIVEGNRLNVDEANGRLRVMIERAAFDVFEEDICVDFVPRGHTAGGPGGGDERGARPVMGVVNQRFTFDRYLPADGNRIARQCCLDVLGGSFSVTPVVLYGRPGLGKTHLLHALASRAASAGWSVACLSAEEFTSRFTGAIRERAVHDFHESVRTVRLLLIDDLQDLAGKKATQEEFVHTIDAVSNGGGYVVAASEQHPLELNLPERLSSRLTAGVAAQIEPFIADERRRYIELLAEESGVAMPEWAVDRMAGIEAPSVRVLQGAINAGLALARDGSLDLGRLDAALIQVAVLEASTGVLAERELLERVARHFELCFDDLLGASRKAQVAAARAVVAAVLQERGKSLSQIGGMLSRHRSTINELAVRGRRLLEADAALRARVG